jgi:iron complex transport system permease protein
MYIEVFILIAILAASFIASLSIGPAKVGINEITGILDGSLTGESYKKAYDIIVNYRLPRTLLSIFVGISLASSGCALQALFRNPLADPYILGVSSGASVGAALSILLGVENVHGMVIPAFVMALLAVYIVYSIGKTSTYSLLLAGVAIGSFLSGLTSLLIYIAARDMHKVIFWIMGGFWTANWEKVTIIFPALLLGITVVFLNSWKLNAVLLGEEHALSVGVDISKLRKIIIGSSALLTASAVSVSGVIGFVGIIIPHSMRLLVGEDHRILIPASILFAAAFMPAVDILARSITSGEIPVGIITAMLGAPFFVYLLRRGWR